MERTNSNTVRVLEIGGSYVDSQHGPVSRFARFQKDNGRIVKILINPTFQGICLAAGFVGSGGRHIS